MDVSSELGDPTCGIDDPCSCRQHLPSERAIDVRYVVDSSAAAVAQCVDEEAVGGLVCGEEG